MRGDLGRIHGSVGVAISQPRLRMVATKNDTLEVHDGRSGRALKYSRKILDDYGVGSGVRVDILEDIPEHVGFGSGTQLALAIGTAISKLYDLDLDPKEIAVKLERSQVSGIGTHGFIGGGFIVDAGHSVDRMREVAPVIFRRDVPEDWLFVVGLPEINKGFSGDSEQTAFKKLKPPPAEVVAEASRLVLMKMIPSIIDEDVKRFGEAMTSLDGTFGDYWIEVQGGRYSHQRIEECVNYLLSNGAYGAGQSSWGPAFYGLTKGIEQANRLSSKLDAFLNEDENRGKSFVTPADNKGAEITVES
jgi:beta-ribofuranosylaminobenzene 5'-phosphate synthase